MKLLKYITTVVLLVSLAGCSVNEENFPVPLDEVLNNNGAYLRILSVESAGFDILDLENAAYVFEGEVFDKQEGDLLESVEFFVSYTSTDGATIAETSEPVKTYTAADFTRGGQNNLPQTTINISIEDVLTPLGLTRDDLQIGDTFRIRWDLNLTDGRTFSASDASTVITGGAFFSSPYLANVGVVAAIPQDQFVGTYQFTQQNPSSLGPVFGVANVYSAMQFEAEITVDPNNTLNGRTFQEAYLAAFGAAAHGNSIEVSLANDTADNSVTLAGFFGSGLSCGGPELGLGPESEQISQFDLADDSEFLMVIQENPLGGCGGTPTDVRFQVVKQ
jgi:hypothetical protein